jgi:hypothetical protein
VAVSPKNTKTVYKQAILNKESDETGDPEVLYTYTDVYVTDPGGNEVLYNNSPIVYNSSTSPTA